MADSGERHWLRYAAVFAAVAAIGAAVYRFARGREHLSDVEDAEEAESP